MARGALLILALARSAAANGRHDAHGHVIEGLAPQELAVSASGKLGDRAPSYELWSKTRKGAAPYPYPKDRKRAPARPPRKRASRKTASARAERAARAEGRAVPSAEALGTTPRAARRRA